MDDPLYAAAVLIPAGLSVAFALRGDYGSAAALAAAALYVWWRQRQIKPRS